MIKIVKKIVAGIAIALCVYNDPLLLRAEEPLVADSCPVKKVIVFDIGGVLATYSKSTVGMTVFKEVVRECGFFKTVKYALSQGSKIEDRLRDCIYGVLDEIGKGELRCPIMYDEKGNPHPRGLCLLHAGYISSKEFTATALHIIQAWCNQDRSLCKEYRRLRSAVEVAFVRNTIKKMGNGDVLATIFKPCKEGIALLRQALQAPGVEVMILSNYPIDQFKALLNQPFMKHALCGVPADHIMCSGQLLPANIKYGLAERRLVTKPHPASFAELILFCSEKWNIQPRDIIFIDNQAENVLAARSLGIDGLLVNSVSKQNAVYGCTFKELRELIDVRLQLSQTSYGLMQSDNNLASLINSIITSKAYSH